jgi:hypothetical protein
MPDERRRIVLEKSKTVKRRWQRSNQRFQFTPSQIERLDREQEREKKAKQLRENEKKRIATKKRKAEEEARVREERKRRGIPDPHAPRVPSSQPLLSMFLGAGKSKSTPALEPKPDQKHTFTETKSHEDGGDTDSGSAAGDTEAESDAFDDLDEELEHDLSELDAGAPEETASPAMDGETKNSLKDEDEFSEFSSFDEDIMNQADAAFTRTSDEETKSPSLPQQSPPELPSPRSHVVPSLQLESSFGGSFLYDPADFLEAEAAIMQPTNDEPNDLSRKENTHLKHLERPCSMPALGSSFRDETADWIEEAFAHGIDDPFGQPNKIPLQ